MAKKTPRELMLERIAGQKKTARKLFRNSYVSLYSEGDELRNLLFTYRFSKEGIVRDVELVASTEFSIVISWDNVESLPIQINSGLNKLNESVGVKAGSVVGVLLVKPRVVGPTYLDFIYDM